MSGTGGGERKRLRDLGIAVGHFEPGPLNAITDVAGVRVGHSTLISGEGALVPGKGPVRTGVTAVVPGDDIFEKRALGGGFVLNGAGELSGLTQLQEWGLLETPILLCNTMSVGKVSDATVKWMIRQFPAVGTESGDVVIPVVGECDDSFLNDVVGRHVRSEHVYQALDKATGGAVIEGSVGAGTGMVTCDFKGGIGTSSRQVPLGEGVSHIVGVLVLSNWGVMPNLRIDGVPVGQVLEPEFRHVKKREHSYGSIVCVVATDAPLLPPQVNRICKRAALGIGRCGSYAAHGSGELVVGFSTANKIPRKAEGRLSIDVLLDDDLGPMYEAVIEATEEAIVNALCASGDMKGKNDNLAPGLPLERVAELMKRYRPRPRTRPRGSRDE